MKKLLLILLSLPIIGFGQLSSTKISKIKAQTTYVSKLINKESSVFLGKFETRSRSFDKSNIGSHIKKNLIECGFTVTNKEENADYIIEAIYATDLIAKKQILGLWLSMVDNNGNDVLSWQFERNLGGMILKPQEIGEFIKLIIEENLSSSVKLQKKSYEKGDNSQISRKEAISQLKELNELLKLKLISQEEFDKKAVDLKKIILE